MFNSDNYPDRYLVTDTDSILHYELMEERKYKLEINLITIFIMSKTYQVFLGTNKPSGGVVTTYEWSQFLKQIDATFSEGYTVQKAIGRWRGVNENTFLLTVITDELKTLQSLCLTYKQLFDQESVLIQELPTNPIFI